MYSLLGLIELSLCLHYSYAYHNYCYHDHNSCNCCKIASRLHERYGTVSYAYHNCLKETRLHMLQSIHMHVLQYEAVKACR